MRIAFLTHYATPYGANRSLLDLVLALRAGHGVRPHVLLAASGPFTDVLERHAVPFAVVPWKPWVGQRVYMGGAHHRLSQWLGYRRRGHERERHNVTALPLLVDACRQWAIDLLHVNSAVIGIGPALSAAVERPWVWHLRELIGPHFGFVPDGGTAAFARRLNAAHAVIAVSDAVRRGVPARMAGRTPVQVVHNAVHAAAGSAALAAEAHARWDRPQPFRLLMVGVFHPAKGQLEAVEAVARLRAEGLPVTLTLVGGGDDAAVRERIAALGITPYVELTGHVDDPRPFYRDAHALLMCSRHEAFGRVTVEALTAGLPVIGHRSGGTPELVADGRNGLLYDDAAMLIDHVRRLATDPAEARRMGEEALRSPAVARTTAHMAAEVAAIYSAVLARHAP
ncbi:MAG: glycosyltransferase family 4 protein [Flavobacteriales bacterium]|jgi:glycosyltransferase involved in cell wall biosynthesis|nr:glycosyltransferase family 4 protein [Flavobacteriales bacterium]